MEDRGKVLDVVKSEVQRRLNLDESVTKNIEHAKKNYQPLHPHIFSYKVENYMFSITFVLLRFSVRCYHFTLFVYFTVTKNANFENNHFFHLSCFC